MGGPRLRRRGARGRHSADPAQPTRHPDRRVSAAPSLWRLRAAAARAHGARRPVDPQRDERELSQLPEPLQGVRARSRPQRGDSLVARGVRRYVKATFVLAVLSLPAAAAPAQSFRQKEFDAYVTRGLQVLRTPGAAVAVVKDGRVLFARGYGVRTLGDTARRSEEHTSELQSRLHLVCRLLLEKKKDKQSQIPLS